MTWSVTSGLTLTDNRDFENDAEEDMLLSVSPGMTLRQIGGRSTSAVDYSVSGEFGVRDTDAELLHNLNADNTTELVRDRLFLDASAGIDQRVIDNTRGIPTRQGNQGENLSTVQRYRISPSLIERFGSFAAWNTRLAAGYVSSGSSELDDESDLSASTSLSAGPDFTSFFWSLSANYEIEDPGAEDERKTQTYRLDTETAIDPEFSLLGGIGYEKIQDDTLNEEPEGLIWDAGFHWRPGRKLSLRATYGERFEEPNINADLDYNVTERTTISASYSQTLTTQQQLLLSDLSFIGVDENGNLIDTRTGLPLENFSLFGLSDETFRRDIFTARVASTYDRDRLSYVVSHEVRESGSDDASEVVRSVGVTWSHDLTRSMTLNTSLDYDNIDFGGDDEGRVDHLYTFRTGVSEALSEDVSANGTYIFRHLESNQLGEDATENAIVFSLTKTF